ncbi:MAG: hypothetical protein IIY34_00760, partial [Clostridia bacterium]|nr:hypothetical protein [Clostridia bacterium]
MAGVRTASGSTGGVYVESSSSGGSSASGESSSSSSSDASGASDSGSGASDSGSGASNSGSDASSGESSSSESGTDASSGEGASSDNSSDASDSSSEGGQGNSDESAPTADTSSESGDASDENSGDGPAASDTAGGNEDETEAPADTDASAGNDISSDMSGASDTEPGSESGSTGSGGNGGSESQSDTSDDEKDGFNLIDLILPIISDDKPSDDAPDVTVGVTEAAYENDTYTVTVTADEGTFIPEGAELTVTEIGEKSYEYRSYGNVLSDKLDTLEIEPYDIPTFVCYKIEFTLDGETVIPDGPVDVAIEYKKNTKDHTRDYCFGLVFTREDENVIFVDRSIQDEYDVPAVTVEAAEGRDANIITHLFIDNYEMQDEDTPNVFALVAVRMEEDDIALIHELAESERTERGEIRDDTYTENEEPASEEPMREENDVPVVSEDKKITYDYHTVSGDGFTVTAKVPSDAGIPAEAQLEVADLDDSLYADYFKKSKKAVGGAKISAARYFDISFVLTDEETGRHNLITPKVPVEMTITLSVSEAYDFVKVISFTTKTGELIDAVTAGENVTFSVDDSAVYGVLYMPEPKRTVRYSIARSESVELSEIFETLGINAQMKDVSSLETDNPAVTVREHKPVLGFIGSHRWTVKCNSAFNEPITLTATLNDGSVYIITLVYDGRATYTLDAVGETYKISMVYDDAAKIPEGAELAVREIDPESDEYAEYSDKAANTLGSDADSDRYARFFDITIMYDGAEIQPAAPVDVKIELFDIPKTADTQVVHFGEEESVLESSVEEAKDGSLVAFETDGFSVFGIVGTVIEKNVLASDGHNYKVTVTYGADTGIPENAELSVNEILDESEQYGEYVSKTESTLGMEEGSAGHVRLFDIKIVDRDDPTVQYQPAEGTTVDVKIELADTDTNDFSVVHFDSANDASVVEAETEGSAISFAADGFSVYAIVPGPLTDTTYTKVRSLDDLTSDAVTNGFYIGHTSGYYLKNTTTTKSGRTFIQKTGQKDTPNVTANESTTAARYYFEDAPDGKYYIYCLVNNEKKYLVNNGTNSLNLGDGNEKTAFTVEVNSSGVFNIHNGDWYVNMSGGSSGNGFACAKSSTDANNSLYIWKDHDPSDDPYDLDGMTYGLMTWTGGRTAKALMADVNTGTDENDVPYQGCLDAKFLSVMEHEDNAGDKLYVPNNTADTVTGWTFVAQDKNSHIYYLQADNGKYLKITTAGLDLVDVPDDSCRIKVTAGTGKNKGMISLKSVGSGNAVKALTYSGKYAQGYNT